MIEVVLFTIIITVLVIIILSGKKNPNEIPKPNYTIYKFRIDYENKVRTTIQALESTMVVFNGKVTITNNKDTLSYNLQSQSTDLYQGKTVYSCTDPLTDKKVTIIKSIKAEKIIVHLLPNKEIHFCRIHFHK